MQLNLAVKILWRKWCSIISSVTCECFRYFLQWISPGNDPLCCSPPLSNRFIFSHSAFSFERFTCQILLWEISLYLCMYVCMCWATSVHFKHLCITALVSIGLTAVHFQPSFSCVSLNYFSFFGPKRCNSLLIAIYTALPLQF